jgi:hypothetical protein
MMVADKIGPAAVKIGIRPLEWWRHLTKVSWGYNHGHLCLSLQAPNLAHMKLPHRWAQVGWGRCIVLVTPAWSAP